MALKVSKRAELTVGWFPIGIVVRECPTGVVVFNNLSGTRTTQRHARQNTKQKHATPTTEIYEQYMNSLQKSMFEET